MENFGVRTALRGKKGKALPSDLPPRLYKVACSLKGDKGFLMARPTVVGWFICDIT